MNIQRAEVSDMKYLKFKKSLAHNTAFVAKEDNVVIAVFEYNLFHTAAQILNISFHHSTTDKRKIFAGFINELFYWNPYITEIITGSNIINRSILINYGFKNYKRWIYKNKKASQIVKLNINSIIPEQLTVNIEKVKNAAAWIKSPSDIIVGFVYINGHPVVIDGYSRLTVACYRKYTYVYGYEDTPDDNMLKFYKECLRWCKEDNINSIEDLSKRLVTPEQHQNIWVNRCSEYFKNN